MLLYGHRGSPRTHRENSVAGVVAAFENGADGVELDVRRTGSGLLLLSHDPLDGSPADAVADALDAARGRVVLEVKNMPGEPDFDAPDERTAHLLVTLLGGRDAANVTVSSFDWFAIGVARDAGLRTAFLTPAGLSVEGALAYAVEAGHDELHPHWSAVLEAPGSVEDAHAAGKAVVCWTVDDADVARRLRAAGVDGVITNDVASLRAVLDDD
jgi:glycerophosphoryl diester phosphodiesterase